MPGYYWNNRCAACERKGHQADVRNGAAEKELRVPCPGLILSSPDLPGEWEHASCWGQREKKNSTGKKSNTWVCVGASWRKNGGKGALMHLPTPSLLLAHVMQRSHALLKVCGVHGRPSLWTVFLFICRFQRPSTVPLINLPWRKKKTAVSAERRVQRGYQSDRCEELL